MGLILESESQYEVLSDTKFVYMPGKHLTIFAIVINWKLVSDKFLCMFHVTEYCLNNLLK